MLDENDFSWKCSSSSTQPEQQTPFAEFAWSVQQLCKEVWPSSFEEVLIERLGGGSFNRIIGITTKSSLATVLTQVPLPPSQLKPRCPSLETMDSNTSPGTSLPDQNNNYILRIPRYPDDPIDEDFAILCYVRSRSTIPVPQIVAFDLGTDNPLSSPYSLQVRIRGVPLISVLYNLTQDQRRQLAIQLAEVIRKLQELTSPVAGQLGFPISDPNSRQSRCSKQHMVEVEDPRTRQNTLRENLSEMMRHNGSTCNVSRKASDSNHTVDSGFTKDSTGPKILHFTNSSLEDPYNGTVNTYSMREGQVALGCIQFQLTRNMMAALEHSNASTYKTKPYTRLLEIAREMDDLGFFHDDSYNLYHHDLEPRNIMVRIDDSGALEITGILDWDQAKFVPRYVSCDPPRWLWYDYDDDAFDDINGDATPEGLDMKEVKQLFDGHVGEDFVKLAYPCQYELARRLFRFAVEGVHASWDIEAVDDLIDEWSEFRDGLREADEESTSQEESDDEGPVSPEGDLNFEDCGGASPVLLKDNEECGGASPVLLEDNEEEELIEIE